MAGKGKANGRGEREKTDLDALYPRKTPRHVVEFGAVAELG
jgi:hypothetical protein